MPKKNKFNGSINKPFVPEKKQDDKKARNVAIVLLLILAFCCFGSVLAIGLTVKDCTTASAEEVSSNDFLLPEGYPNLFVGKYRDTVTVLSDGTFSCTFSGVHLNVITDSSGKRYISFPFTNLFFVLGSYTYFFSCNLSLPGLTAYLYSGNYGFYGTSLFYRTATPGANDIYAVRFYADNDSSIFPTEPFTCVCSVGMWSGLFTDPDFASSVYYQAGLLQGQTDGYKIGYNEGYSNGYVKGEGSIANSLGFFQGATVTCGSFLDFSSWDGTFDSFVPCPSSFYVPYYSGLYFKIIGEDIYQHVYPNSSSQESFGFNIVSFDFGLEGKKIDSYAIFNVVRWISDNNFVSTGEYGSGCTFYFVGGKSLDLVTADGYFSSVDLTSYLNTPVRRITFDVRREDIRFFGLTSNPSYNNAYNNGFSNGKSEGYTDGFSNGKNAGYSNGYSDGVKAAGDYTFLSLLGAVVDAPLQAVSGMLNFNLLGFNMLNFFYALLTCALVIAVIRLIL